MVHDILAFPRPELSLRCEEIAADDEARRLLDDLRETMHCFKGLGLAAPQIGVLKRAIVVKHNDYVWEVLNPRIVKRSGIKTPGMEGCLSAPRGVLRSTERDQLRKIARDSSIEVAGHDRNGNPLHIVARAGLARAFAHEVDHIDGVTIFHANNRAIAQRSRG